ncbi:MAG: Lrp/AsnC family transcriptional regulator [Clostridia bacterium]|nr:Lrp/AsnC family transcriptional regulator [Clostridia bacterium]
MENINELDKKILKILSSDARTPLKTIADSTFVSAPTVASRIEILRERGVIKGYYTEVAPNTFGDYIKAFIDMEVSPVKREELYGILRSSPFVTECCRVTGEYSLLIEGLFKNTEEMDKFINVLQHYGRTNTRMVLSNVVEHRPFIPD